MKVYIAMSFDSDNHTAILGACADPDGCKRLIELHRREAVSWAVDQTLKTHEIGLLNDGRGDAVAGVRVCDVFGSAQMEWSLDTDRQCLTAVSVNHHDGQPLTWSIDGDGFKWVAKFDGHVIASGTLEECMTAARISEDDAILEAVQQDTEMDSQDPHGRLLWMLKRLLNPEDLGRAVPAFVRDEVRSVLGMSRCES